MALVIGKSARTRLDGKLIQDETEYQYTESDDSQNATSKDAPYKISTSEAASVRLSFFVNTEAISADHMTVADIYAIKKNKTQVPFEWGGTVPGSLKYSAQATLSGWDESASAEGGAMQVSVTANIQGNITATVVS